MTKDISSVCQTCVMMQALHGIRKVFCCFYLFISLISLQVHAVYPKLTGEQLIRMSAEEIIATDPKIAKILDSTKHLSCQNSREFSKEINKYIDSKDQKRGDKKV